MAIILYSALLFLVISMGNDYWFVISIYACAYVVVCTYNAYKNSPRASYDLFLILQRLSVRFRLLTLRIII